MNLLKSEELAQFNEEYDGHNDARFSRWDRQASGRQPLTGLRRSSSNPNVIKEENSSELTTS